jgi:hypothetical protein
VRGRPDRVGRQRKRQLERDSKRDAKRNGEVAVTDRQTESNREKTEKDGGRQTDI